MLNIPPQLEAQIHEGMAAAYVPGLAVAVIHTLVAESVNTGRCAKNLNISRSQVKFRRSLPEHTCMILIH